MGDQTPNVSGLLVIVAVTFIGRFYVLKFLKIRSIIIYKELSEANV